MRRVLLVLLVVFVIAGCQFGPSVPPDCGAGATTLPDGRVVCCNFVGWPSGQTPLPCAS